METCLGKSDPHVFSWYAREIQISPGSRVLFLGQPSHNDFTRRLHVQPEFRDITLGNWDINGPLDVDDRFDAVVCTRCAYFSRSPAKFLDDCRRVARSVFVDWGLGDHWRFEKFRVGWRDEHEQEFADYAGKRNFLYSTVWRDDFLSSRDVQQFTSNIAAKGYSSLKKAVFEEVPQVHLLSDEWKCSFLTLWPDSPQLYVLTKWSES